MMHCTALYSGVDVYVALSRHLLLSIPITALPAGRQRQPVVRAGSWEAFLYNSSFRVSTGKEDINLGMSDCHTLHAFRLIAKYHHTQQYGVYPCTVAPLSRVQKSI